MKTAILIITYLIINIYTASQTDYWLLRCFKSHSHISRRVVFWLLYIIFVLPPFFGAYLPNTILKFDMAAIGNVWLGFYIYYTGFLLIAQIIRLLIRLFSHGKYNGVPRHIAWVVFPLIIAVTLNMNIYGIMNAQDITTTKYNVTVNKNAGNLKHLKIALVADFHLGCNSNILMYKNMVAKLNEAKPDLVIVAGDIFNSTYSSLDDPKQYSKVLSGIKSKYGVFAVYGNHDVEESLFGGFAVTDSSTSYRNPKVTRFMKDSGFTILDDDVTTIANDDVILAGRRDGEKAGDGTDNRADMTSLLFGKDKNKPILVIEHEPVDFNSIAKAGGDFVLSGHTHDGQLFPGNIVTEIISENSYGLKTISGTYSLVTSGLGYYGPPIRVGTHSEIAVINMSFK